jgi:FAD/FMN-containing dehydrogenase
LFGRAIAMGGKISGEHGIGLSLAGYLPLEFSAAELRVLRGVKDVFDPRHVLNPGKPFDR